MTDNIIKFQKPVDLHKELAFRMNVVSTAEKFYIKLSERQPLDLRYDPDMCIAWAEAFHNKAQPYIDEIMAKIEKEAK
jgi:hypothetical protein